MQYKTLVDYGILDKLRSEINDLEPGLWLLDLDPRADTLLLGPFDSISEAHDKRDYIWNYGDRYGRYLWLVSQAACATIKRYQHDIQHVELAIDTLPLEVTGMKLKVANINGWISIPRKRMATK